MASAGFGVGAGSQAVGPDLQTIQTDEIGFRSINGEAKVRLTSAWTKLPEPTASLLSVASGRGLVAAAGPDYITIATTDKVRKAFESPKDGDSEVRSFEPELKLQMPMRVSHLAFTADENYLILSAEAGGGLAVYEVQSLLSGNTNSAFELPTNGESLRGLIPNPTAEKAELCAAVTTNGNLCMANLKERALSNPLLSHVSCAGWSAKGKQLCAGLSDGTIRQLTPEGESKAEIPRPPNADNHYVSSLIWLENHLWLAIYLSNGTSSPSSVYNIITREPPSKFGFQRISDPVEPFNAEKPPHHALLRLRDFPPDLQDLLIIASTANPDIGLLSRSKKPLASDQLADTITGVFATTEMLEDTSRPTLPMTDSMDDSVPIGIALDLSSKEKVYRPIPADEELNESATPLPGLWALTHEGLLCSWWCVYNDAVKKGVAYPHLAVADGAAGGMAVNAAPASTTTSAPLGSAGGPAFGQPSAPAAPSFGSSSQLGAKPSLWGSPGASGASPQTGGAAFGQSGFGGATTPSRPAFGKPSSFGQSSQVGIRSSPWANGSSAAPAFGQTGFSSFGSKSPGAGSFSAAAGGSSTQQESGGFSGFASKGGFGSLAANTEGSSVLGGSSQPSVFGAPAQSSGTPFGSKSTENEPSVFGAPSQPNSSHFGGGANASPFGSAGASQQPSVFGTGSSTKLNPFAPSDDSTKSPFSSQKFELKSSFKPDASAGNETNKPSTESGGSMFGNGFGSALDSASKTPATPAKDSEMDDEPSEEQTPQPTTRQNVLGSQQSPESTTPQNTPGAFRLGGSGTAGSSPAPGSSLFGQPTPAPNTGKSLFGAKSGPSQSSGLNPFSPQKTAPQPQEAEPPLPPDPTSKPNYPVGESSASSAASTAAKTSAEPSNEPAKAEDAPLPPDFAPSKPKSQPMSEGETGKESQGQSKPDDAPLPPDFTKPINPFETTKPVNPFAAPTAAKAPVSVFDQGKANNASDPNNPFAKYLQAPVDGPDSDEEDSNLDDDGSDEDGGEGEEEEEEEEEEEDDENEEVEDEEEGEEEGEDETGEVTDEDAEGEGEDDNITSEGSGVDVAKDLSPESSGLHATYTPQGSFQEESTTPATAQPSQQRPKANLFGQLGQSTPIFPRPQESSPRSPSPVRAAVPNRLLRPEQNRSVSAPGMASQMIKPRGAQASHQQAAGGEREQSMEDPTARRHRLAKERREKEEAQPLVDEDDEEVKALLASELQGKLVLDEFVAHVNTAPPAQDSIPAQVEAVYRDINSMIDTVGLNSRSVKEFIKGHTENRLENGRNKEDFEIAEDWVLCEVDELGRILDNDMPHDLQQGRVTGLDAKLEACQHLAREIHRVKAKCADLDKIKAARTSADETEATLALPLTAEQAAQQNELRRILKEFSKLLAEAESALSILRTRLASASGASGKRTGNMPTVEAVMRTIAKMTAMAERRSGDVDVLETQLRKMRLSSAGRDGTPMATPQPRKSVMFSPEPVTPSRSFRQSFSASVGSMGSPARSSTPRKKLSGFSAEEKKALMDKRAKRQAVLGMLKDHVEKKGVQVWNTEDID